MKRVIACLLSIILMLCFIPALAEDFTLHSGVKFGMNKEEVINAEKNAGFADTESEDMDDMFTHNCSAIHEQSGVKVKGQIAGVDDSLIHYHFNKDGVLDSAVYDFTNHPKGGVYSPIRESLIKKYGTPDIDFSEIWHSSLSMCVYSLADKWVEEYNIPEIGYSCKVDYLNNDSWLVPQDDGSYIIITGCECNITITKAGTFCFTFVGYQHFDKEVIENTLAEVKEKADNYNSQLENDL